jgi:16S rRNA (cytosine967-C5)-methyltransferase
MTPGARIQAAIDLLAEIGHGAAPADEILAHWARRNRYAGGGDRRAIRDLVFQVVRRRRQFDWWLSRAGVEPSARLQALAALVLALHWDGDRLDAAFGAGRYAAPPLSDSEQRLVTMLSGRALDHPDQSRDVHFNYPKWLDPHLAASLGDALGDEMAGLAAEAPVDLRVNTLKANRETALRTLRDEGIEAGPTPWSPLGLRLTGRVTLQQCVAWRDGLIELQDEGSQLAALLVGARSGEAVADLCAGGGGKTLALAAAMENAGRLVACDTSATRLRAGRDRLRRAGVTIVEERVLAASDDPWVVDNRGAFDRVLVDAPCSGSGAWRRSPDARWRLTPAALETFQHQQAVLLDTAAALVRPGGQLIYVTCSVLRAENEDRVDGFLAGHGDFRVLPVTSLWNDLIGGTCPVTTDCLNVTPHGHGTDGFFVAVLERET